MKKKMKETTYTLRALAFFLTYPDEHNRLHYPAALQALVQENALSRVRLDELKAWANHVQRMDALDAQAHYVETFDRARSTCLNLFEHVHGDSRERGAAMIDLKNTYAQAGLQLGSDELPDHLCVILEFASTQPADIAQSFLAEMAHILNVIFSGLVKRQSHYASVLGAVLELAGHKAQAVKIPDEVPLDESWQEPEVFNGCSTQGQAKPDQPQPIHFVGKDLKKSNLHEGVSA